MTQSSAASICNASQEAGAFKSGMQNATFEFPVKVKDEKPVFYYCAVKMHCQMGMFVRRSLVQLSLSSLKALVD